MRRQQARGGSKSFIPGTHCTQGRTEEETKTDLGSALRRARCPRGRSLGRQFDPGHSAWGGEALVSRGAEIAGLVHPPAVHPVSRSRQAVLQVGRPRPPAGRFPASFSRPPQRSSARSGSDARRSGSPCSRGVVLWGRDRFVNLRVRFSLPEAAAVRRPPGKPPSPCLIRYRAGASGLRAVGRGLGRAPGRGGGDAAGGGGRRRGGDREGRRAEQGRAGPSSRGPRGSGAHPPSTALAAPPPPPGSAARRRVSLDGSRVPAGALGARARSPLAGSDPGETAVSLEPIDGRSRAPGLVM